MKKHQKNELMQILIVLVFIIGFFFVQDFTGFTVATNYTWKTGYLQNDTVHDVFAYKKDFADNLTGSYYYEKGAFPTLTYLAVHDVGLDIIDANTNTRWMSFNESATNALDSSTFNTVTALGGSIYVGSDNGLYDIDFDNDTITRYNQSGYALYSSNITARNSAKGYGDVVNAPGHEIANPIDGSEGLVLLMHLNNETLTDTSPDLYRDNQTTAYDYSLAQNNGTLRGWSGYPIWNTTTKRLGVASLTFIDVNDHYVAFPSSNSSLNINTAMTFAAWIYPLDRNQYQAIYARNAGVNSNLHQYIVYISNTDKLMYYSLAGANTVTGGTISYGQWQHVAFNYNGSCITLYQNGVASTSCTAITQPASQPTYGSYLGASWCCVADDLYWYKGNMDEVAIWNRSLSGAEMASIYANGTATHVPITGIELNNQTGIKYLTVGTSSGLEIFNLTGNSFISSKNNGNIKAIEMNKTAIFFANGTDLGRILDFTKKANSFTYSDYLTLKGIQDIEINDTDIFLATNNSLLTYGMNDLALNLNLTGNQSGQENNFSSIALNGSILYAGTYGTNGAITKINLTTNTNIDNWSKDSTNESLNANFTTSLSYLWYNATNDYLLAGQVGGLSVLGFYTMDTTPPTVLNLFPLNNSNYTYASHQLNLTWNVTDAGTIVNCSLFINNNINTSNNTVIEEANQTFNLTFADGSYLWNVQCEDAAGNKGNSSQFNITLDTTAPTIQNIFPFNNTNASYALHQMNLTYNVTDFHNVTNCSLYIDNRVNKSTFKPEENTNQTFNLTFADGSYLWNVECRDEFDNLGNSSKFTFAMDTTPPTVRNIFPLNNSNYSYASHQINLTYNATNAGTIANCSLFINNEINKSDNTIAEIANQTFNLTFSDGSYLWNVQCEDAAGNKGNSSQFNITLDTTPPTVQNTFPLNNSNVSYASHQINLTYNVTDFHNITNCSLYIDNNVNWSNISITENTNQTFNLTFADGSYLWNVECRDEFDNLGNSSQFNITLDTTPPTVQNTFPLNNSNVSYASHQINLTYNVTDFHNITNCSLYIDNNVNWSNISITENTNQTFNLTFADGSYLWNVECRDEFDNLRNSSQFNITLDTTGPIVNLLTANQTAFSTATQLLEYNVTDSSNVTNCSLFISDNIRDSSTAITRETTLNFTTAQTDGTYVWTVQCKDEFENSANASKNQFTVSSAVSGAPALVPSQGASGESGTAEETIIEEIIREYSGTELRFGTLASGINTINTNLESLESVILETNRVARDITFNAKESNNYKNPAKEKSYRYFIIDTNLLKSNINQIIFNFKVRSSFGDAVLQRYTNEWKTLPTKKIKSENGYDYYQAVSYGLSAFAVTRQPETIPILEQPLLREVAKQYVVKEELSKKDVIIYAVLPICIILFIALLLAYLSLKLIIKHKKLILPSLILIILIPVLLMPFTDEIFYFAILPLSIISIFAVLLTWFIIHHFISKKSGIFGKQVKEILQKSSQKKSVKKISSRKIPAGKNYVKKHSKKASAKRRMKNG